MSSESKKIVDTAVKDPEKFYKTPEAVLRDTRLSGEEKDQVLHNWEMDQLALIRAEDENMTSSEGARPPVDLLDKIKKAEKTLDAGSKKGETP